MCDKTEVSILNARNIGLQASVEFLKSDAATKESEIKKYLMRAMGINVTDNTASQLAAILAEKNLYSVKKIS